MNEFAVVTAPLTVRIERVLPGPIERVWSYLIDPEKRATWFCGGEMEPKVGGRVELVFDHDRISPEPYPEAYRKYKGARSAGKVTRYEPPRALAYTWGEESGGLSEVAFELTAQGDEVLLVLTHAKLPNRDEMVNVSGGWHAHLEILSQRLQGMEPAGFWSYHSTLDAEYRKRIPA